MNPRPAPDWMRMADEARESLMPVPADADDVCPVCRSWRHSRYPRCSNCMQTFAELAHPSPVIIPVTLYSKPSQLRDWLKRYKSGPEGQDASAVPVLAAILRRFMFANGRRLFELLGGWDRVVVVPSASRNPPHPLTDLLPGLAGMRAPLMDGLVRGEGELGHRVMSEEAFTVREDVEGRRILLVDDVFTTGAHAQSAASALHTGGAVVAGVLVLARRINPEFNEASERVWERQRAIAYDYERAVDWLADHNPTETND